MTFNVSDANIDGCIIDVMDALRDSIVSGAKYFNALLVFDSKFGSDENKYGFRHPLEFANSIKASIESNGVKYRVTIFPIIQKGCDIGQIGVSVSL